MLATPFLQLSPVDLLDDAQTNPTALLPDVGGQAKSGFAELLRLRVDASQPPELASGETPRPEGEPLLPGGNFLPRTGALLPPVLSAEIDFNDDVEQGVEPPLLPAQQTEPLPTPLLALPIAPRALPQSLAEPSPTPNLAPAPGAGFNIERPIVGPDISLNSGVVYPAPHGSPTEPPDSVELRPYRLPLTSTTRLEAPASDIRANDQEGIARLESRTIAPATPPVTRPELAARAQEFFAVTGERVDTVPTSVGLRERGQTISPEVRILPVAAAVAEGEAIKERLQTDILKQQDLLQLQRVDSMRDAGSESAGLRNALQHPTQTPLGQSPAQAQAVSTVAQIATTAGDIDVSTVTRQAPDLVNTPVRDSAWGERIGERVVVMAGKNLQSAEIRLTPAELGPLRVRISVDDGTANVTFHAQHAVTRDALEQAMPRLREMLAENGLTLGQADVAEQGVEGRDRDGQAAGRSTPQSGDESDDTEFHDNSGSPPPANKSDGLVDTFA